MAQQDADPKRGDGSEGLVNASACEEQPVGTSSVARPRREALRSLGGESLRFFVVGLGATALHWGIYVGLNALFGLRAPEDAAALSVTYTVGYALSFIANYLVSLKWTFRTQGSVSKGVGFAFSHAVNYGMHLLLLNLFLYLGLGEWMAACLTETLPALVHLCPILGKADALLPLPVYMVAFPLNFLMVRYFLKRGDAKSDTEKA